MHNFYISGAISIETFDAFQFFWQNIKEDKRDKSISIYINSNGGCTVSTLAIVQQLLTMSNMGYTIHTFGQKNVASGAFIIFYVAIPGREPWLKEPNYCFTGAENQFILNLS